MSINDPEIALKPMITDRYTESDLIHIDWLERCWVKNWKGLNVLDLGCRSGYLCQWAMEHGASYALGVDIEDPPQGTVEKMLRPSQGSTLKAKTQWLFKKLDLDQPKWGKYILSEAEDPELKAPKVFDMVLAFDIVEHLSSPWLFFGECYDLLSEGGILAVTTPNTNSWERFLRADSWSGVRDPQHKTLFNKHSLTVMLRRAGFFVDLMRAPIRSLSWLGPVVPDFGAQCFCICKKKNKSNIL